MTQIIRGIVDFSSVGWSGLFSGTDEEFGYKTVAENGKEVSVNSAVHGYENVVDFILGGMKEFNIQPSELIIVVEGKNSKALRTSIFPEYKANRKGNRTDKHYEEFNKMKTLVTEAFRSVGASIVSQDNVEADDVIAYLTKELDGIKYIFSNDKDLSALINDSVHLFRMGEVDAFPYGPFERRHVPIYQALVGDKDNMPGAKGFGNKAFLDLLVNFGDEGLDLFEDLLKNRQIPKLVEDLDEFPKLQKVIDDADNVYMSYDCAILYPSKVNTLQQPLVWEAGMVKPASEIKDERLKSLGAK